MNEEETVGHSAEHPLAIEEARLGNGLYEDALRPLERAVKIDAAIGAADSSHVAARLTNLALVYWKLERLSEAEPLLRRATQIRSRILAPDHPHHATSFWGLANIYRDQGRFEEAEALYRQALDLRENALPPGHRELRQAVAEYAVLLRATGRYLEASQVEARTATDSR